MSNYSEKPQMCRVDFWKESGKWYCTEAVEFLREHWSGTLAHDAFRAALINHLKSGRLEGMTATCLDPYIEHSHPLSLVIKESWFR